MARKDKNPTVLVVEPVVPTTQSLKVPPKGPLNPFKILSKKRTATQAESTPTFTNQINFGIVCRRYYLDQIKANFRGRMS